MTKQQSPAPQRAAAFFHPDGFVPSYNLAKGFAGNGGRIGTLPDVIDLRLANEPDHYSWERYLTTMSAEYKGMSRGGNEILIVAHGIGPMATMAGVQKAYAFQYKDDSRSRNGGRISQQEFLKLESGAYGQVSIVDLGAFMNAYTYPFLEILKLSDCLKGNASNPFVVLTEARLGPRWYDYLEKHEAVAKQWHAEQKDCPPANRYNLKGWRKYQRRRGKQHRIDAGLRAEPYILQLGDASNCPYRYYPREQGLALAHLLTIGQLTPMSHSVEGLGNFESLLCEVDCHGWSNGTRLFGVRQGDAPLADITDGPDMSEALRANPERFLEQVPGPPCPIAFSAVMTLGENHDDQKARWYTMRAKVGERMDTWSPEYPVHSLTRIGNPVGFETSIGGFELFFKYGIREVRALAPSPQANAYYFTDEPGFTADRKRHRVRVQFCHVEVDTTRRLPDVKKLQSNQQLVLQLLEESAATA